MLSAAQHAIRATGIGSSEIAAICGEDPFQSALDVWLLKTGRAESKPDTVQTRMGNRLEYAIACEFADRHSATIETCTTVRHPQHEWIVASPDRRVVGTKDLLECKNVGYRMRPSWTGDDGVYRAPPKVLIQGTWQCLVTGDEAFWVAAFLGGRDYHEERVAFDPEFAAALVEMGGRFWIDCVRGGAQPTPDGSARTRELLQRLYPRGAAGVLDAPPPETETIVSEYARARARESAAKKEKEAAGNKLRAILGTFDTIDADWGKVTWKAAKKGKVAWNKVAKDAGADAALIAKHTGAPGRSLNVNWYALEEDETEEGSGDE